MWHHFWLAVNYVSVEGGALVKLRKGLSVEGVSIIRLTNQIIISILIFLIFLMKTDG